jgi:hypothetical protein
VGDVTRRGGFDFRRNSVCGFSRVGDSTLVLLRFGHVAGFGSVPRSAADMEARPPGGDRESGHPNQQQHDASYKKPPVARDDSLHVFAEGS